MIDSQIKELSEALLHVDSSDDVYRFLGNLLVKFDKLTLKSKIKEDLDILNLRLKKIEEQEQFLNNQLKDLQQEILSQFGVTSNKE